MKEKINKNDLSWLTTCPQGDINFKCHLRDANIPTLESALKNKSISKTARKKIQAQLNRLKKKK